MSKPLPSYESPPVIETVLGIGFAPVPGATTAHLGALWHQRFRSEYPRIEEKPWQPLFPPFPADQKERPRCTSRLWLWHASNEHVIQLQTDALLSNWVRQKDKARYLPYQQRKKRLQAHWQAAEDFFREELGRTPRAEKTLVLYVNHIPLETHPPLEVLATFFRGWRLPCRGSGLPKAASAEIRLRFPLPASDDSQPQGASTLDVSLFQVEDENQYKFWRFELLGRAQTSGNTWEHISEALDVCHERVVMGFTDLTTPEAHKLWGRIQ